MSDWLVSNAVLPDVPARVVCFPYAGGDPRRFLGWQPSLAEDAEIVAVRAPRALDFEAVADGAAEAIATAAGSDGRPVYLFGHSLGGLIAFEVARRLRDLPALRHLVASGISAPSRLPSPRVRRLASLEGRAFAEELRFFGGLPPEVFEHDGVLELLLPQLMADFRLAADYRYRPAPPLAVDVTLIVGRDDPHVGPAQLEEWADECDAEPVCHRVDGGHLYLNEQPAAAIDVLRARLRTDRHAELI